MNIAEFLLARIAEDERVAALSVSHGTGEFPSPYWQRLFNGPGQHPVMAAQRLLAECDAKRRIVEIHEAEEPRAEVDPDLGEKIPDCTADWEPFPCRTLCALALPYADHPDYDPEWGLAHASSSACGYQMSSASASGGAPAVG